MDQKRWERVGAASGIVAVVLIMACFAIVPAPPKLNNLPKTITYLADHRTGVLVQSYLFILSTGFAVWFASSVRTHLRRNEGGTGRVSDVAFGGALVGSALLAVSAMFVAGSAFRADTAANAANIRLMADLGTIAFAMAAVPVAIFVGATAVVSMRSGAFPMAHYVAGFAVTLALVGVPLLLVGDTGFFSVNDPFNAGTLALLAFLVWEAVTSVMLIVGEAAEVEAEGTIITHEHWHLRRAVGE